MDNFTIPTLTHDLKSISITNSKKSAEKIIKAFNDHRVAAYCVIYKENEEFNVEIMDKNIKRSCKYKINSNHTNYSQKFCSKSQIQNLSLNIAFSVDDATFLTPDGKVLSKYSHYIDIIAQKMNASINYVEVAKNAKTLKEIWEATGREIKEMLKILDLFLESSYGGDHRGYIYTHHLLAYCYIAPLPPKIAIYDQILFRPMDKVVWIYCGVSIVLSALIWRIFKNFGANDSLWHFIFGVFAFFVGQSVKFKM